MKHCAKKLLGLAFALALCLAVGGTALAQTPEFADVPDTLPEQEMLAYEPYAAPAAEGMNTITGDGYTVTIPTTVEVKSGENKETLMVTASVKQLRILKITLDSTNSWQLKHESGQVLAGYSLMPEDTMGSSIGKRGNWWYEEEQTTDGKKKSALSLWVAQKAEGDFDINWKDSFTVPLIVEVTDPSQATMSGTYSDTVSFEFGLTKQCITYTVNVYEQKLQITNTGTHVEAVNMVDADGTVQDDAKPVHTEILEYPITYDPRTWSYSSDNPEDAYRWEELTMTRKPAEDVDNKVVDATNNATINLNRRYKWYWLDVNGVVNSTGAPEESTSGNGAVGCYLDIRASVDGKNSWSEWFSYGSGDDYWGTFPYGTYFEIGFYNPKPGYAYDTDEAGNVKVIANGVTRYTARDDTVGGKEYKIFEGQLTGEPKEAGKWSTNGGGNYHAEGTYQRYCFNVCCRNDTITYNRNYGTATTESRVYDANATLPKYSDVFTGSQGGGVEFAGWSTKQKPTSETEVYQPGTPVTDVNWETDKTLYAQWGYEYTIQYESEKSKYDASALTTTWRVSHFEEEDRETRVLIPGITYTIENEKYDKTLPDDPMWMKESITVTPKENDTDRTVKFLRNMLTLQFCYIICDNNGNISSSYGNTIGKKYNVTITIGSKGHQVTTKTDDKYYYARPYGLPLEFVFKDGPETANGIYTPVGYKLGPGVPTDYKEFDKHDATGNPVLEGSLIVNDGTPKFNTDGVLVNDDGELRKCTVWVVVKKKTTADTPMPGPSLAPAKKALTLRYHANFDPTEELALDLDPDPLLDDMDDTFGFDPDPLPEDVDDALEGAVKIVSYQPGEDVVLRNCMFKRGGYVFVGWNTEPDGTGKGYEVDGVPRTDWAAGDTVDLYAQWKKPEHLKPVVDDEPFVPADPDTPPEWVDDVFGVDPAAPPEDADTAFGVDPAAQPDELDAAFGVDPDPLPEGLDDAFGVDPDPQPEELDDAFGVDPDPQPEELDDAFGVDPDPLPDELDDAFSV